MTRALSLRWLALGVCALAVVGLFLFAIGGPPGRDSSAFIYVADGMAAGESPYVDRWDHKGPLIYLLDATGRWLTPDAWTGIHLLELASLLAAGVLGFGALRPAFGTTSAAVAMVVAGLAVTALVWPGNFTEEWALLPMYAAVFLFTRARGSVGTAAALAIGALGALAFLLRPDLVAPFVAIGLTWLLFDSRRIRLILLAVAGGLAVLAVAAASLAISGTWGEAIDAVFGYSRAYTGDPGLAGWVRRSFAWLGPAARDVIGYQVVVLTVLGWAAIVVSLVRRGDDDPGRLDLLRWVALAVPIGVVLVSTSSRTYEHYYLALVPALSVTVGFVWHRLSQALPEVSVSRHALVVSALGAAWMTLLVVVLLRPAIMALRPGDLPVHELAAAHARSLTSEGDTVWVWGAEPLVYLLADRDSPSRYFYQLPLMTKGYVTEELVASVLRELEADPPALIIDARDASVPPLEPEAFEAFLPEDQYDADPELLRPILDFVESGYVRGPDLGPWASYERR